jgi:hypothetical protein
MPRSSAVGEIVISALNGYIFAADPRSRNRQSSPPSSFRHRQQSVIVL